MSIFLNFRLDKYQLFVLKLFLGHCVEIFWLLFMFSPQTFILNFHSKLARVLHA